MRRGGEVAEPATGVPDTERMFRMTDQQQREMPAFVDDNPAEGFAYRLGKADAADEWNAAIGLRDTLDGTPAQWQEREQVAEQVGYARGINEGCRAGIDRAITMNCPANDCGVAP